MYRKVVLHNGVRLVAERMPAVKSVAVGVWLNVGSRDEGAGEEGLSHFLEHMFFKGTASRSAAQISHEIDGLGGELNAFTTRETTTFYTKVLNEHLVPAVDLLADLFHHSRFAPRAVEREKQVVLEEIRMLQDDPEDLVQELHIAQMLSRHPLGRPILGSGTSVRAFRRADLLRYIQAHYLPQRTVIAVAGDFEFDALVPLIERAFGSFERTSTPQVNRRPPSIVGGLLVQRKPLEQVHLSFGFPGIAATRKDRAAAFALNAVLGGSVSSRLFQEIREKRGLAYSIYSYLACYSDSGTFTVYAATRPREAPRVVELVWREIRRLRSRGVDRHELEVAKNQMKGSLMLSLETTQSRMSRLAKDELTHGRHFTLDDTMAEIDRVSAEDVLACAQELFEDERLSLTALGPVSHRALIQAFP